MINKIISGGQTGSDLGGLLGAEILGISTGGWAPRDYRTEKGNQGRILKNRFGLKEHISWRYSDRTEQNIIDSDMTLLLYEDINSSGTQTTIRFCEKHNKPCLKQHVDFYCLDFMKKFIDKHKPIILNISGNRESISPGICSKVKDIVVELFEED